MWREDLYTIIGDFLHMSTWLYMKMFQTYMNQNRSFVCEERDRQLQNNEEWLEEKVQSKFKSKIHVHECEIQHSMQQDIHCIMKDFMEFVLYN